MEVRDQVVRNNRAWGNSDHGIMLRTMQDSVVENNVVAGNAAASSSTTSNTTSLRGNLVVGNRVGVHLSAGSTRNKVEGNDFIGNREQVRYVGARDEDWGQASGNHWSNYRGWDPDGDGRGDVPYEANDLVDRLIWRHPRRGCCWPAQRCRRCAWWRSSSRCCAARASSTAAADAAVARSDWSTGMESNPRIELRAASRKHYGAVHAVDGVDLDRARARCSG